MPSTSSITQRISLILAAGLLSLVTANAFAGSGTKAATTLQRAPVRVVPKIFKMPLPTLFCQISGPVEFRDAKVRNVASNAILKGTTVSVAYLFLPNQVVNRDVTLWENLAPGTSVHLPLGSGAVGFWCSAKIK